MRPSITFCLLSLCMQLKLHECEGICMNNQYTIIWSNGSVKNCLHCEKCHPGFGLSPVCGTHIKYPPKNIGCDLCPSGTFSDTDDSAPCQNCQECVPHELVASNCTRSSDRNCTGTCTKGYYFAKKAPHNCQQCSYCCGDGKDEIQPECVNQGLNATKQHCSLRLDKKCGPEPTPIITVTPAPLTTPASRTTPAWHHGQPTNHGQSNSIIIIVLGVVAGLFLAALLVICAVKLNKWRKGRTTRFGRHDPHSGETADNQSALAENQVGLLQVTQPRVQALRNTGFSSNSNPVRPEASPGGTPCQTDDELDNSVPDVVVQRNKRLVKRQTSKDVPESQVGLLQVTQSRVQALRNPGFSSNSNPVTPEASPGGTPCQTDDELDNSVPDVVEPRNKRLVKRQSSKDAASNSTSDSQVQTSAGRKVSFHGLNPEEKQDIEEVESGQRRRSRSGSLHSLMRKLSGAGEYQPLAGEDPDEIQESLRIVQHPTHQTHKEGSRVVFECKAQGKKNLTYQWLKDGTKIQGQKSCTLVLDSVKVRDFGGYSCEVWYAYGQLNRSECAVSSPGELDVLPRDGMRYKYLDEAFQQSLDTQQKVEKLLEKDIPGGGGWRQVAFKWKMDIDDLERSHEEGKGVISNLKATYPYLTVYDFCKTLKEPNIKRFDIIKELLLHLVSVPQEQTA